MAPQVPLWVWGLKTRPKSWPIRWNFWVTCYLQIMFPTFQTLDPPPAPPPPLDHIDIQWLYLYVSVFVCNRICMWLYLYVIVFVCDCICMWVYLYVSISMTKTVLDNESYLEQNTSLTMSSSRLLTSSIQIQMLD